MSSKRWFHLQVDESLYDAVNRLATNKGGQDAQKYATDMILAGLIATEKGTTDPTIELFIKTAESDAREMRKMQVMRLASRAESENDMDQLEEVCRRNDIDFTEVLEQLKSNSTLVSVVQGDISERLKVVSTKLLERMTPGVEYPAQEVQDFLIGLGVADNSIKRIKKACNVQSFRRANNWVWVIPKSD